MTPALAALTDRDLADLERALDALPEGLEPLDVVALDGYLCGVLLQPRPVAAERWLPRVFDVDGRPLPAGADGRRIAELARRRHAELDRAIGARQWFDPWVFELDDTDDTDEAGADAGGGSAHQAVLPWVAGFAAAMDAFPDLMALDAPALMEPLAVLYSAFDADDLEDADELLALIETLEPPADMAQAVEDLVRSVLLIADVTRPVARHEPRTARAVRPLRPASQKDMKRTPQRKTRRA